jgi:DNA-binding GntR family transcriptional regulator
MNKEIYQLLTQRILFLEYEPGQILNEKVLADEFGVSRTPLREVFSRLEWDGLVRILPRTGTMVSEIEFPKMMHTYQIRFEVEGLLGRLSTIQFTPEHLARMEALAAKCAPLHDHRRIRDLVDIDIEFRDILFAAADNPVLRDMSNQLYHQTLRLWLVTLSRGPWVEEVRALHDEILATIAAWKAYNPARTESMRRNALVSHFERIRSKYFGHSTAPEAAVFPLKEKEN